MTRQYFFHALYLVHWLERVCPIDTSLSRFEIEWLSPSVRNVFSGDTSLSDCLRQGTKTLQSSDLI